MGLFDFLRGHRRKTLPPPADLDRLVRAAREMTGFDLLTGRLCSEFYREGADSERVLHYGALGAFQQILQQALAGELDAERLLEEHAAKNDETGALIENSQAVAEMVLDEGWPTMVESAESEGLPVSVAIVTALVRTAERVFPRPSGPLPPGHFAVVMDFVAACALQAARIAPDRARMLANEDV